MVVAPEIILSTPGTGSTHPHPHSQSHSLDNNKSDPGENRKGDFSGPVSNQYVDTVTCDHSMCRKSEK